jgi:hypothetical protein
MNTYWRIIFIMIVCIFYLLCQHKYFDKTQVFIDNLNLNTNTSIYDIEFPINFCQNFQHLFSGEHGIIVGNGCNAPRIKRVNNWLFERMPIQTFGSGFLFLIPPKSIVNYKTLFVFKHDTNYPVIVSQHQLKWNSVVFDKNTDFRITNPNAFNTDVVCYTIIRVVYE